MVIKKNIDHETASKYQTALNRAGAECEVRSVSTPEEAAPVTSPPPAAAEPGPAAAPVPAVAFESGDYGDVTPPPQTDPLGITGAQIDDLSATIAPVGSELQDEIKQVAAPAIDTSDLEVAPVGSDIGTVKKDPEPPPPDTAGMSMAE